MVEVTKIPVTDVANLGQQGDLWVCIRGYVYDISSFIEEHPGGEEVLRAFAGKDATDAFEDAAHSEEVIPIMNKLKVGRLSSLQQPNATFTTQAPAKVVSSTVSGPKTRQSHVSRGDAGKPPEIFYGLFFAMLLVLTLSVAVPGFALLFVVGATTVLLLLVYCFIAVISRHRLAADYADYIQLSLIN